MTTQQDASASSHARSSALLSHAEVRRSILGTLGHTRPHLGITGVSREAPDTLDARLRAEIESEAHGRPFVGKTFKL